MDNGQSLCNEYRAHNKYLIEQVKEKDAEISRLRKALKEIAINCDNPSFKYIARQALEGNTP